MVRRSTHRTTRRAGIAATEAQVTAALEAAALLAVGVARLVGVPVLPAVQPRRRRHGARPAPGANRPRT